MSNLTIQSKDKQFEHNGQTLVIAVRGNTMGDGVDIMVGDKINSTQFRRTITTSWHQDEFNESLDVMEGICDILSERIANQYGPFSSGGGNTFPETLAELVEYIADVFNSRVSVTAQGLRFV